MTRSFIAGFLLLGILAGTAHAFGLGREGLGFGKLGVANKKGVAGPAPPACTGTIDLSTGCVQPMLR
jgi:hypothetical protein